MSQMMSSASSIPTEMRIRSGGTPPAWRASSDSCRWVVLAGWMTRVRVSPMLARWLHSSNASMKARPAARPPGDAEREHGAGAERQVTGGALVVRMVGKTCPAHPRHAGFAAQRVGNGAGIGEVGIHPLRQRLDALHQQERVEGRQRRADVAELFGAQPGAERVLAEVAPPRQVAVRRHRLGHPREVAVAPVELAGFDHDTAERRAVTSEELRRRVHDDVGAPLDRPAQIRSRHRRVDDQWDPGVMGDRGQALEIGDGTRTGWRRPRCRSTSCCGCSAAREIGSLIAGDERGGRHRSGRAFPPAASVCRRTTGPTKPHGRPSRTARLMARNSADWPLAVATAPMPPSRLAIRSSNAATVGLLMRV